LSNDDDKSKDDDREARPEGLVGAVERDGFNVHAGVRIEAGDHLSRERLARYGARPPLSLDRLRRLPGGRVGYRLKYVRRGRGKYRIMTGLELMASAVERRIRDVRFPEVNTIDAFDFDFDPARKKLRARYLALHDLAFVDKGVNPLFIGHPGTGKTFLARALAYKACTAAKRVVFVSAPRMLNDLHGAELHGTLERKLRRYTHADLLVVDDFAVLAMDAAQAKLAFQVISERYDYRRSTAITTNRSFKDWTKVFPDALNAQVIAERLTERSEHFVLDGKGFRNPAPKA
jgi:DNA replication protein DnaC